MERREKTGTKNKRIVRKQLMIGLAGIIGFVVMLLCLLTGHTEGFDDPVRNFFYGLRSDWLTPIVRAITYLGNWQTIVILCLALLIIKPTRITYGIPVSAGAIFVTVLNRVIKHLIQRPRPDDIMHLVSEGGFSFPSGHSITSMFVYGMLIYLVRSHVKNRQLADVLTVLLCIPLIGVGLSRIYLGVHYPTDVLAGWFLGIATIALAAVITEKRQNPVVR